METRRTGTGALGYAQLNAGTLAVGRGARAAGPRAVTGSLQEVKHVTTGTLWMMTDARGTAVLWRPDGTVPMMFVCLLVV